MNGCTPRNAKQSAPGAKQEKSPSISIESSFNITLCYVANTTTANGTANAAHLSRSWKSRTNATRRLPSKRPLKTPKRILEVDISERKFGQDEEKMVYFFLLLLRKEHFNEVGIEIKALITTLRRGQNAHHREPYRQAESRYPQGYLIANFKDAFGNNATKPPCCLTSLKAYAKNANIQDGYNEVYSDTNASRKRKPLCRNKPRRKRNNPMNRNPKRSTETNRKRKK